MELNILITLDQGDVSDVTYEFFDNETFSDVQDDIMDHGGVTKEFPVVVLDGKRFFKTIKEVVDIVQKHNITILQEEKTHIYEGE